MKKKSIVSLLLILSLLACLAGCGKAKYKDNVSLDSLTDLFDKKLGSSSMEAMNSGYLSGAMHLDPTMFGTYVVKLNARGVNIDEYGIFKAKSEDEVEDVKDAVEGYLKLRRDTWMKEYMPEEKPKLDKASVTVCGRYVMYLIVSDELRSTLTDSFVNMLKA